MTVIQPAIRTVARNVARTVVKSTSAENIQLKTGFETDLSGFVSVGDGVGVGTREAAAAIRGGFGAQLLTDAIDGQFVRLTNTSFAQPTGRVVTDLWFHVVGANDAAFEVATEGWTGSRRHLTSIRWIDDTGFTERLQYWNRDTSNWSAVPGGAITLVRDVAHHLQVTIDWATLDYIDVTLDGVHYSMTGIKIEDVANVAAAFMQVSVFAWTHTNNPLTIYFDDLKLSYPDS